MLLSRNHNKNVINAALEKSETLNRIETLKRRVKKRNDRVI
jgi:hypothetical protein